MAWGKAGRIILTCGFCNSEGSRIKVSSGGSTAIIDPSSIASRLLSTTTGVIPIGPKFLSRALRLDGNKKTKLTKKTLETHEVNEALLLQGNVIENLAHAIEYVVEGYDTSAQVISDIHRLLKEILNVRFIPTGKEFYQNVPIRQPRQLAVILANATTKLGAREDVFDKRHARLEIGKAMIFIRKTRDRVSTDCYSIFLKRC